MKKFSDYLLIWGLILLLIIEVIFLTFAVSPSIVYADDYDEEENTLEELALMQTISPIISELKLGSRRAVIFERNTGTILYEKNADERAPMASTTKILTAIVVLENVDDLNKVVTISKKAANTGGSVINIKAGDKITIHDLLCGLLIKSGNNAAVALAEEVGGSIEGFTEMMNKKALELGLKNTHLVTPHGLDADEHYTTAKELAIITDYALKIPKFKEIVGMSSYNLTVNEESKYINNTNELLGYLDGVYGVKTGFTNKAGRCLVTATKRGNMDIICVVLGADTKKIRSQDSIKLIEYAFKNFEILDLQDKINKELESFSYLKEYTNVIKGKENKLTPVSEEKNTLIAIKTTDIPNIKIEINCADKIYAPVNAGAIIGSIDAKIGNEILLSQKLYIQHNIKKKGICEYIIEMISNYNKYVNFTLQIN